MAAPTEHCEGAYLTRNSWRHYQHTGKAPLLWDEAQRAVSYQEGCRQVAEGKGGSRAAVVVRGMGSSTCTGCRHWTAAEAKDLALANSTRFPGLCLSISALLQVITAEQEALASLCRTPGCTRACTG